MPRNQLQRMVFAFITVVITVHAYVFYSLYVINGNVLMQMNGTGSVLAAWLYYAYYAGFHIMTLLANWLKLICLNFPFAYFTQLFFIQPMVRTVFKALFRKDIEARAKDAEHFGAESPLMSQSLP